MKIQSIDAIAIEIPLRKNFGGATYSVLKRCTVMTRVRGDEGLAGEVYNGDNRSHGREIVLLIRELLAPRVRGMDILEVERAWQAMFDLSHTSADRKTLMEAIACVDCALWDLVGRSKGKSVSALLGGIRWNRDWVNVSTVCIGEYVGLEEIDNGIWNVYFGPLKLGRLNERHMRIEDQYGRLRRKTV